MKRLFMVFFIAVLFCKQSFSQPTPTFIFSNYVPQAYAAPKQFKQLELTGNLSAPQEGENLVWDFSDFTTQNPSFFNYYPVRDTLFPGSNILIHGNTEYIKGTFIPYDLYMRFDGSGNAYVARYYSRFAMGLGFVSGNADDSLIVPNQASPYTPNLYTQQFPQTFDDTYISFTTTVLQGEITFSLAGYDHEPFTKKTDITRDENITGWGKAIIPLPSGGNGEYICLLQKSKITTVDSFFVNGESAPAQLLAAFGMQQGNTNTQSFSYLYAQGRYEPLITYVYEGGNFENVSNILLSYDELGFTVINENTETTDMYVFPNPNSEAVLYFHTGNIMNGLRITDANGKKLYEQTHFKGNSIVIPNNWNNGIYYIQLFNNEKNITRTLLLNR